MRITINNNRKIFSIQEELSNLFPNILIEFYGKPNKQSGPHSSNLVKSNSKTLGDCRAIFNTGEIEILPNMSVGELKQNLGDVYGLAIELFKINGTISADQSPAGDKYILEELNK